MSPSWSWATSSLTKGVYGEIRVRYCGPFWVSGYLSPGSSTTLCYPTCSGDIPADGRRAWRSEFCRYERCFQLFTEREVPNHPSHMEAFYPKAIVKYICSRLAPERAIHCTRSRGGGGLPLILWLFNDLTCSIWSKTRSNLTFSHILTKFSSS